jgi:chemotaxis protein CheD
MSNLVVVGIADQNIATPPDLLVTYALGSCVGICLYDPLRHLAGLAHILLPEAAAFRDTDHDFKYADTAIEALIKAMEKQGSSRYVMTAKIAGGANMFAFTGVSIGERNIEAVKKELHKLGIKIIAEDVGSNYGRTIEFNPENGDLLIKAIYKGNKVI